MVRSIDENDFDRRFPKGFGRSQTTKTAADDHYSRCLRLLPIRIIDRIEISICHLPFLKLLSAEILENLSFSAALAAPDESSQRRGLYQASQKLISRIRTRVVKTSHGTIT